MAHGKENSVRPGQAKFSARGIEICVEYIKKRGHETIVAWVPQKPKGICDFKENQAIIEKLENEGNHIKKTMTDGSSMMQLQSME